MRLEIRKYLYDIEHAAGLILSFTAGKDLADYQQDAMLRLAVERALTIIGEALSQLAKAAPDIVSQIPEYKRIIAFRNILIHAYAEIDDRIVWDVADREVPELRTKAAELLAKP